MSQLLRNIFVIAMAALLIFLPGQALSEPSIGTLWKARALEAKDKLDRLAKQMAVAPIGSDEYKKLKCETLIEFSYFNHVYIEDIAHKYEQDREIFHIILNGGKEAGLFDLLYVYQQDGKLAASRIDLLPKEWRIVFVPGLTNSFMLRSRSAGCIFYFDLDDPFNARAL